MCDETTEETRARPARAVTSGGGCCSCIVSLPRRASPELGRAPVEESLFGKTGARPTLDLRS